MKAPLLDLGDTAFGMLVDMTDLPETAAMLRRSADGLQLVVPLPWSSPYEAWFDNGTYPETLWLVCGDNRLALVGCYGAHTSGQVFGVREGRLFVSLIVHGAKTGEDYRRLHGMRTSVPGLGLFLGQRSLEIEQTRDASGRLASLTLDCSRVEPVARGRRLNFAIERGFAFSDRVLGDQAIIEDQFHARTEVKRTKPWEEHLTLHWHCVT